MRTLSAKQGPAGNRFPNILRRTLRRSFFGATLIAATGCGAALGNSAPNYDFPDFDCQTLTDSFQRQQPVTIAGERLEGLGPFSEYASVRSWIDVSQRHDEDMQDANKAKLFNDWVERLPDGLSGKKLVKAAIEQMKKDFTYENDEHIYGFKDYAATPSELIARKKGDCEDLAMFLFKAVQAKTKHAPLRNMYLARVDDTEGNAGGHRVLVLDNEFYEVTLRRARPSNNPSPPARKSYTIYFAMNDQGVWHAPRNMGETFGPPRRDEVACKAVPGSRDQRLSMMQGGR